MPSSWRRARPPTANRWTSTPTARERHHRPEDKGELLAVADRARHQLRRIEALESLALTDPEARLAEAVHELVRRDTVVEVDGQEIRLGGGQEGEEPLERDHASPSGESIRSIDGQDRCPDDEEVMCPARGDDRDGRSDLHIQQVEHRSIDGDLGGPSGSSPRRHHRCDRTRPGGERQEIGELLAIAGPEQRRAVVLGRLRPDGAEARPSDARRRACSRLRSVRCSDIGDVLVAPPDEGVPVPADEAGGRSEMVEAGEVHEHPGDGRDAQDHAEQAGAHRHASSAQPGFQRQPRAGDRAGREAGPAPEAGGERRPDRRGRALTPGRRPRSHPGTAHDEGEEGDEREPNEHDVEPGSRIGFDEAGTTGRREPRRAQHDGDHQRRGDHGDGHAVPAADGDDLAPGRSEGPQQRRLAQGHASVAADDRSEQGDDRDAADEEQDRQRSLFGVEPAVDACGDLVLVQHVELEPPLPGRGHDLCRRCFLPQQEGKAGGVATTELDQSIRQSRRAVHAGVVEALLRLHLATG